MHLAIYIPLALLAAPELCDVRATLRKNSRLVEGVQLEFAPQEGARVRRTVEISREQSLEEALMEIDGEVLGEDEFSAGDEHSKGSLSLVVVDEYSAVDDQGELTRLTREFELIEEASGFEAFWEDGEEQNSGEGTSELEGEAVVFEWDEEQEDYLAEFAAGSSGDVSLLDGLDISMDLEWFLPQDSVEIGAVWEIEPDFYELLTMPGGDLAIEMEYSEEQGEEDDHYGDDEDLAGDDEAGEAEWSGTIRCELAAIEELEGRSMGYIELELEVEVFSAMEFSEADSEGEFSLALEETETHELKGELIWDLKAGHAHSLELTGEMTTVMHTDTAWQEGGESGQVVGTSPVPVQRRSSTR
ncbi:MAG: hypothetical protein QF599_04380 [Planctomycetota bacterium]|nr:hypothetical protein [Planctomycetota bacterium]